jgi:S-ribosylhomocysteine lyase
MDVKALGWDPLTLGEIDHRDVCAPYVRMSSYLEGAAGDVTYVYDLRVTQPNSDYLTTGILHSFEHLLLAGFRKYLPETFVSVAPMGCQTGFYLILQNEGRFEEVCRVYRAILDDIVAAGEVPYASPDNCGQAVHHDLAGSKKLALALIAAEQEWGQVF